MDIILKNLKAFSTSRKHTRDLVIRNTILLSSVLFLIQFYFYIKIGSALIVIFNGPALYLFYKVINEVEVKKKEILVHSIAPLLFICFYAFEVDEDALFYNIGFPALFFFAYAIACLRFKVRCEDVVLKSWIYYHKMFQMHIVVTLLLCYFERRFDFIFSFGTIFVSGALTIFSAIISVLTFYHLVKKDQKMVSDEEVLSVTALSKEDLEMISKLDTFFKESDAYLDMKFDFNHLIEETKLSRKDLSRIIKVGFYTNFYQLLAEKRIEIAKQKLEVLEEQFTIEGVMLECGFSSKSVFNKHFKNFVGMTPSQYLIHRRESRA